MKRDLKSVLKAVDDYCAMKARPATILAWAVETFGDYAKKPGERASRLLEEAVELAQSVGVSREVVDKIVNRAFERPAGDYMQELAQVGMCVEVMAAAMGADLSDAIDGEIERVKSKPKEHWSARAAEKKAAGTENVT